MDRTERFYKIELLIRTRGSVPFADLMHELGVSRATLKRDLEYLRERMDAPIVYDRFANGYRFDADSRDQRQVRHELPGLWFSESEIHALLTMHQLIGGLDEGGVLARHLQPLLDKLYGMLGTSDVQARDLVRRVKVMAPARRPVAPRHFETIGGALTRRQRVQLQYWVRTRREMTERTVSPLWVLDEPFVALDVAAVAWLAGLIGAHLQRGGMVVLTTHQAVDIPAGQVRELKLS